jgi:uncharacterized membrane protein
LHLRLLLLRDFLFAADSFSHHAKPMSEAILDMVLRPSPPMTRNALGWILLLVLGMNLAIAGYFLSKGAWPIAPFLGLDVLGLVLAFRASLRAAERREHVVLTAEKLRIVRAAPGKTPRVDELNPYWVRVEQDEEGLAPPTLWSHGKSLLVGAFLGPAERLAFSDMLARALVRARS